MRAYEKFKSEATRLVSITCDWNGCDRELWSVKGQPMGQIGVGRSYPSMKFDLCPEHLDVAQARIVEWLKPEAVLPPKIHPGAGVDNG